MHQAMEKFYNTIQGSVKDLSAQVQEHETHLTNLRRDCEDTANVTAALERRFRALDRQTGLPVGENPGPVVGGSGFGDSISEVMMKCHDCDDDQADRDAAVAMADSSLGPNC